MSASFEDIPDLDLGLFLWSSLNGILSSEVNNIYRNKGILVGSKVTRPGEPQRGFNLVLPSFKIRV